MNNPTLHNLIYIHRLSPFLFKIWVAGHPIGFRWYGMAYGLGFLLAFFYLRDAARRNRVSGLNRQALEALITALVLGVLVGGRLGFVLQHPHKLFADPLFALRIWEGGMAFFGGLAGVLLAIGWAVWRFGLDFWAVTDVLVFPTALALAFGRIANFVNAELVGRPTGANWGVIFPTVDKLPRRPSQLYEAASHFLLFGLLLLAARHVPAWAYRRGRLSLFFLALYGGLRFLTDFYRADDAFLGPFSTGQWASLLVGAGALVLLCLAGRRPRSGRAAAGRAGQPEGTGHEISQSFPA